MGGGGPPPNNPTPAPPYATHTENPDDPDGPGHGPLPNLAVNFQNACPNGYVLAFSNGNGGNPNGGAYCGEDTSLTYQQILVANLIDINLVFYGTGHYWNRHLACYVHTFYTNFQWNNGVIGADFKNQQVLPTTLASIPYIGAQKVNTNTGSSQFGYRASYVATIQTGLLSTSEYYVGTSYLVPPRIDCPKPYPMYP